MRMTSKDYFDKHTKNNVFGLEYAFIGVDLQNDFGHKDGTLYVKGGEELDEVGNEVPDRFDANVFWTQDWHPANHCSFKTNGGIWPVHCVQYKWGSQILDGIFALFGDVYIKKGEDQNVDSYSAFFDNDKKKQTALHGLLQGIGVKKLLVMGIATDYCVKFTVLDAISLGYEVYVYLPGCRGVSPETTEAAIKEMEAAGAIIIEE